MEGWKVILLLVCLNVFLNFGVLAIGGTPLGDQIVTRFLNVDYSTGNVVINGQMQSALPTNPNAGVNIFSNVTFTDGLGTIWNAIIVLLNIFTAPIGMLSIPSLNPIFSLIFIIPLVVLELITLISAIRGFPI